MSVATESPRVIDLVASFDAQLQNAARQNAVESRVPYAQVQTIVPGANYGGKANTAAAHARMHAMKQGVDPALNKRFETATEATEYRKREGVEVMSPKEYEAETSGLGSSRRRNAWIDSPDTGSRDPETGKKVAAFRGEDAFRRGNEVLRTMENMGSSI